jgi:hypothetical protein
MACRHWWRTPWWPDAIDAFLELLTDPGSPAWRYDDGSGREPRSAADHKLLRERLRTLNRLRVCSLAARRRADRTCVALDTDRGHVFCVAGANDAATGST